MQKKCKTRGKRSKRNTEQGKGLFYSHDWGSRREATQTQAGRGVQGRGWYNIWRVRCDAREGVGRV